MRALQGPQDVAHRFRCGATIRPPHDCFTRTEVAKMLGIQPRRLRAFSTRPHHVHHRLDSGPHCHRITFVPRALVEYLFLLRRWRRLYGAAYIPPQEVDAVGGVRTAGYQLAASWATERNWQRFVRDLGKLGVLGLACGAEGAGRIRTQAERLEARRERDIRAIIESVEQRLPEYRTENFR